MAELTCQQCRELAAELALDVLPGRERAGALAHLDGCTSCRDTVSALTTTADRLIELIPEAQPPAGFERRVMSALTPSLPLAPPSPLAPPLPRRQWRIAAALLAIALGGGGWVLGHAIYDGTPPQTSGQTQKACAPSARRDWTMRGSRSLQRDLERY